MADRHAQWRQELAGRLRPLELPPLREAEIIEELLQHLEDRHRELRRAGESDAGADELALAELDDPSALVARLRDVERRDGPEKPAFGTAYNPASPARMSPMRIIANLRQDLSYAIRNVRRQPGFAIAAVAMLAIGIAATTTIFTLANGLLLKPLPVARPNEIVGIYTSDFSGPLFGSSSYLDVRDWQERNTTLASIAAVAPQPVNVSGDAPGQAEQAERAFAEFVTANYFDTIGAPVSVGRSFGVSADSREGASVVVLSDALWQRRFQGDRAVVGQVVLLNGQPFAVIGVAPPGFAGIVRGLSADLWVPLAATPVLSSNQDQTLTNRGSRGLQVIGRLKPGVSRAEAQAQFNTLAAALHAAYPRQWTDRSNRSRVITLAPEAQARFAPGLRTQVLGIFSVLLIVASLVLVIACANIGNLLLARAMSRAREIGTRLALGASRARIIQQLLTEGLLLSLVAGVIGFLVATWAARVIGAYQPPVPVPLHLDLAPDARVLLLDVGMVIVTTLLFGLAPSWNASRPEVVASLKDGGGGVVGGRSRLRKVLVVTQVTVSMMLLIVAGLFLRSLSKATAIDPGFDPSGVVLASVDLGPSAYTEARGQAFFDDVVGRLRSMPAVESAGYVESLPLGLDFSRVGLRIDGYVPQDGEDMEVGSAAVSDGHLAVLHTRLAAGRDFLPSDRAGAPLVAIVNRAFADKYWPHQNAIGRRIATSSAGEPEWMTVVGVTETGKYRSLGEDPTPYFYVPFAQHYEATATFVVRSSADPAAAMRELRALLTEADRTLPILQLETLERHLGASLLLARVAGGVFGTMGAIGVLLAAAGLYGVIAYAVSLRTREIGVRLSLGASPAAVFWLIARQGLVLTLIGSVIGLSLAALASQALSSLLYGLSPIDPLTFGSVVTLFLGVAFAACALPARRAMKLDPLAALRHD